MNSDYDRSKFLINLKSDTMSIWTYVNNDMSKFLNEDYNEEIEDDGHINVNLEDIDIWQQYFCNSL